MALSIMNDSLQITASEDGKLLVTDRRTGVEWNSMPLDDTQKINDLSCGDGYISFTLEDKDARFSVRLSIEGDAEFVVSISGDGEIPLDILNYPKGFLEPSEDYNILQTDSQGLLLPVNDSFYPAEVQPLFFCGGGGAMAWIGVVDKDLHSGYSMTFETPYDAGIDLNRRSGLLNFAPVWYSSMGTFSYERRVRYSFFDKGGYVAQCKHYREYIWEKNDIRPLREKVEAFPALEKLIGGVQIFLWNDARTPEFVKTLKDAGVERAAFFWDSNHRPYPVKDFDNTLKDLGYGACVYDLYTDYQPGEIDPTLALKMNLFPGKYELLTALTKDGDRYSNSYGTYLCPSAVPEEIRDRMTKRLQDYDHEGVFLDVYCANGLYECYHPDHPLTREGWMNAMMENTRMIQREFGLYTGSEFGADYGVADNWFFQGMMTLQRTWFDSETSEENSIYYGGDWRNHSTPSIQVGTHTASDTYLKYGINEYTRVPLFELVYHDAAVTTWRWEDGNASSPEIWWKKDLFNMLYGTAPLWSLDAPRWDAFSKTFVQSYENLAPWLGEISYDELVSHRFVTEDHSVQESVFSSGRRILVNFGMSTAHVEGLTLPPKGYQLL